MSGVGGDEHGDSITESAQWGRFTENRVDCINSIESYNDMIGCWSLSHHGETKLIQ